MNILKSQFTNLSLKFYLSLCVTLIITTTLTHLAGGTSLWLISSIFGILYVFFAGQGRPISFIFGIIYSSIYVYLSYEMSLYGDMTLNLMYLPINIFGIITWSKIQKDRELSIDVQFLKFQKLILVIFSVCVLSVGYGYFLNSIEAIYPFLNSVIVILQIVAFVLQVRRYVENYALVLIANILSIIMWFFISEVDVSTISVLLTYIVFTIVGTYYFYLWFKNAKNIQ